MERLHAVNSEKDIFPQYKGTPIHALFCYHNLSVPFKKHLKPELIVGMCMDNRKQLTLPDNFAFIIRSGGGNLRYSEFKVSFAIATGEVTTLALIAHNNCGMVNLMSKKDRFIDGLVKFAGWEEEKAEEHFLQFAPMFEIGNEIDFVLQEAKRLRVKYPKILVAPLMYQLEDNKLYQFRE